MGWASVEDSAQAHGNRPGLGPHVSPLRYRCHVVFASQRCITSSDQYKSHFNSLVFSKNAVLKDVVHLYYICYSAVHTPSPPPMVMVRDEGSSVCKC